MKILTTIFLFIAYSLEIQCQWSTDPNANNAICLAANDQFLPNLVSDNAGGAIITWEDYRNGANYDIYAQRINVDGLISWGNNGVPISIASGDQSMPKITSDGSGGAIITWTDYRNGDYADIYAQSINSSGAIQWTTNGAAICNAGNMQWNPYLVNDGQGGAIIVWQDARDGALDIYAQRINSSGVVLWTVDGVVICNAANKQEYPAIASDGEGGAIITWQDKRSGNDYDLDLYAQRINSNGIVQWASNGISICNLTGNQVYPTIITNNTGEIIITWIDVRNGIDADIYAQRITISGEVLWTENGVAICTATGLQQFPVLVSDGYGGAIITWQDYRMGNYDIYTQRINVSGAVQWTDNGVPLSVLPEAQMNAAIVSDDEGGAIITWRDYRDISGSDIYSQHINSNGIVQWTENGLAISTAINDQFNPSITTDGADGAIITWWDYRNGATSDLYAQQVSYNGQLGVITEVTDKILDIPNSFDLEQNYPNPFNPSATIRYSIPNPSTVIIKVYDLLGKEIETLVNEEKLTGTYELSWDASNLPSGVYFYRLLAGSFIETKKMILLK